MSDTLAEGAEAVSASEDVRARLQRTHLQRRIRQMLLGIFFLDAGVLFVTSVVAWWYQAKVDDLWL